MSHTARPIIFCNTDDMPEEGAATVFILDIMLLISDSGAGQGVNDEDTE